MCSFFLLLPPPPPPDLPHFSSFLQLGHVQAIRRVFGFIPKIICSSKLQLNMRNTIAWVNSCDPLHKSHSVCTFLVLFLGPFQINMIYGIGTSNTVKNNVDFYIKRNKRCFYASII